MHFDEFVQTLVEENADVLSAIQQHSSDVHLRHYTDRMESVLFIFL